MFTGAFNVFRVLADLSHLLSFFLLFIKMFRSRSVEGLSRRTQEIFLLVFVCRYLDIFFVHHISFLTVYNTIMKVFFILSSAVIVASFHRIPWKATYNDKEDSFRHWLFLVLPCAVLGLAFPASYDVMEVLYAFSIFLEAVAIMPQIVMLQRHGNVENLTGNYVFVLGLYRGFYLLNWIYRYVAEQHVTDTIVWVCGTIQTLLYVDFFYYYVQARRTGSKLVLPR